MSAQRLRGQLVRALREAGLNSNPQGLADAICELINDKIKKSEGRHHFLCHQRPKIEEQEPAS